MNTSRIRCSARSVLMTCAARQRPSDYTPQSRRVDSSRCGDVDLSSNSTTWLRNVCDCYEFAGEAPRVAMSIQTVAELGRRFVARRGAALSTRSVLDHSPIGQKLNARRSDNNRNRNHSSIPLV